MLKPGDPAWGTELTRVYAKLRGDHLNGYLSTLTAEEADALIELFRSLDWPTTELTYAVVHPDPSFGEGL
jgi:hypothetical protein